MFAGGDCDNDNTKEKEVMSNGHLDMKIIGVEEDDTLMLEMEEMRGEDEKLDLLIDSIMEIRSVILLEI
jgi:hypothetical protein